MSTQDEITQRELAVWTELVAAWVFQLERAKKIGDDKAARECKRHINFCREKVEFLKKTGGII